MTEIIRLQARGQMVLPKSIRDQTGAEEGTVFAVGTNGTSIILHKITMPTQSNLTQVLDNISKAIHHSPAAKKLKSPQDVVQMMHKHRRESSTRTSSSRRHSGPKA